MMYLVLHQQAIGVSWKKKSNKSILASEFCIICASHVRVVSFRENKKKCPDIDDD
jgi:hypothetical protein